MAETKKKSRTAYVNEWRRTHVEWLHVMLNKNTDADVINRLKQEKSRQGYVKELIRKDIAK